MRYSENIDFTICHTQNKLNISPKLLYTDNTIAIYHPKQYILTCFTKTMGPITKISNFSDMKPQPKYLMLHI